MTSFQQKSNLVPGVSEIMKSPEVKIMAFWSKNFEKMVNFLLFVNSTIEGINSTKLTVSGEKSLQQMKLKKLKLKKFFTTQIRIFLDDREDWLSKNEMIPDWMSIEKLFTTSESEINSFQ